MERFRTNTRQWCDADRVMLIDPVTGESVRPRGCNAVLEYSTAKEVVKNWEKDGSKPRLIMVAVSCVVPFDLEVSDN